MSSFLDKTGLTQLWGKVKAYADKSVVSLQANGSQITYTKGNGTSSTIEINAMNNLADGPEVGSVKGVGAFAATGLYSFTEGYDTAASEYAAHAEGYGATAAGSGSHAEGSGSRDTTAGIKVTGAANTKTYTSSPAHSLAVGYIVGVENKYAKVTAINSTTSFTVDTTLSTTALSGAPLKILQGVAYGMYSHSEGTSSNAIGIASHAEGVFSWSTGEASHAEGNSTRAVGEGSHTEGINTKANGNYSHAEGQGTIATAVASHVQGRYNIQDTAGKYAHIVGNGSNSTASNAMTLDWDGNGSFAGNLYVNGASTTTGSKVATENFVNDTISNLTPADIGAEPFYVMATPTDDMDEMIIVETSASYEEIIEAIGQGRIVQLMLPMGEAALIIPFAGIMEGMLLFECLFEMFLLAIMVMPDGAIAQMIEVLTTMNGVANVNGYTGDVYLSASDVGAVPTSRTINGKSLSSNVTLSASDLKTLQASLVATETTPTVNNSINWLYE